MNKLRKKPWTESRIWWGLAVAVIVGAWLLSEPAVQDFWRGLSYRAEGKTGEVIADLELTNKGERILKASQPSLEGREEFNQHCENQNTDMALLGCYTEGKIYVYEVTAEELTTANQVTMAHELLHATWGRLGKKDKEKLTELLEQVYQTKKEWFDEELLAYDEGSRIEEIYTRTGTKLLDLPEELEKHYAEIFRNRGRIVEFYEQYEAPFQKLQAELEELLGKIDAANREIENERTEYLANLEQLRTEIEDFNNCANQAGCFQTEAEFAVQRRALIAKDDALEEERLSLNQKIAENNQRIEEYQARQITLGDLNKALNSNIEPVEELEAIR